MRFDGKLKEWNDDGGFGLITPLRGGDPVFVHISAFQSDGRRPRIGELRRSRSSLRPKISAARSACKGPGTSNFARRIRLNLAIPDKALALRGPAWLSPPCLSWAVSMPTRNLQAATRAVLAASGSSSSPATLHSAPAPSSFRCDGRTRCSQMTSCEEAKFFLKSCTGVEMDGDRDGIPCETQWCTGGMGR